AGRPRLGRALPAGTLLWTVVMGGAWLYGGMRLAEGDQVRRPGPRIAVVQTNVVQDNRNPRTSEQTASDWAQLLAMTQAAASVTPSPDLIVWPETMVPRPLNAQAHEVWSDSEEVEQAVREMARQ